VRHLDSIKAIHHDDFMRTTVTLDKDVERLLRETQHRLRKSFKQVLNDALRAGLGGRTLNSPPPRFVLKAKRMGLRSGIDPAGLNKLADELETDSIVTKMRHKK
jgi:hypothetical protein